MAVRLELAQLVGDAVIRDNLLSILKGGVTTLIVPETPTTTGVTIAAQLAFSEPDMDRVYGYSVYVVDSTKSVLVQVDGKASPSRPDGADRVFPYLFTIIERLEFVAPIPGYYAAAVALEGKPMKFLPFKVVT